MSILSALGRQRHLDETALAHLWSNRAVSGGVPGAADDAHLLTCEPCRARYASFAGWLDETRQDAVAEAEERFPAERLAAQHAQIARRLEALDRPARIIAFPRPSQSTAVAGRGPQRWIAAAAAAGLVIGLGAGELLNLRRTVPVGNAFAQRSAAMTQGAEPTSSMAQPASLSSEDSFLDDIEAAITTPRVEALMALDAITPRVRDVDQSR